MNLLYNNVPAYRETVTHQDRAPATGMLTARQAIGLLLRARRRNYPYDVSHLGVLTVTRPSTGATVVMTPLNTRVLTKAQQEDLQLLATERTPYLHATSRGMRVGGHLWSIPESRTARMIERGWIGPLTIEHKQRAAVSVLGHTLLAMFDHRTRTSEPRGYHSSFDRRDSLTGTIGPWRKGGKLYDGSSAASCTCGWSATHERRPIAQGAANEHRAAHLLAAVELAVAHAAHPTTTAGQ